MTKVPASKVYATDLDDDQWEIIFAAIELPTGGRPRTTSLRAVINAILYQTKTGCPWHMLPHDFPPEGTVRRYFHFFKRTGQLERINGQVTGLVGQFFDFFCHRESHERCHLTLTHLDFRLKKVCETD